MIEVWDAEKLAGLLMGLDDAKNDLITAFKARQEGDPSKHADELIDAANRWDKIVEEIVHWPLDAPDEIP